MTALEWLVRSLAGALLGGCAAAPPQATLSGVARSEAVPVGYVALGGVRAECTQRPAQGELRGIPVTAFLCSRGALQRALVEQARARGGTVVAAERCQGRGSHLSCSGTAARPAEGAAPIVAGPLVEPAADDLPVTVASRIVIDVAPRGTARGGSVRAADAVGEARLTPVGQVELGVIRARCAETECDDDQARAGLREAAGSVGASTVVGVHCFAFDGERSCMATLAAFEVDPETNPAAR